jgi:hypothetical protein
MTSRGAGEHHTGTSEGNPLSCPRSHYSRLLLGCMPTNTVTNVTSNPATCDEHTKMETKKAFFCLRSDAGRLWCILFGTKVNDGHNDIGYSRKRSNRNACLLSNLCLSLENNL